MDPLITAPRQSTASYFPEAATYEYGMELIEKEQLDIVHICLPSYLHAEHAVKALEKGMNVLVEKPVCLTEEDCQMLLEAEKRSGKKVMVGQVVRSFEEYKYLKEAYDTEKFGKLSLVYINLHTGRHHQIRVQFANAGTPLWGDTKYNPKFKRGFYGVNKALYAYRLTVVKPGEKTESILEKAPNSTPFDLF